MTPGRHVEATAGIIVALFALAVLGWLILYLVRTDGGTVRPADRTPTPSPQVVVLGSPTVYPTTTPVPPDPTEALPRETSTRVLPTATPQSTSEVMPIPPTRSATMVQRG